MTADLQDRLRDLFREQANATQVNPPARFNDDPIHVELDHRPGQRSRHVVALAAAAILIATVGAISFSVGHDGRTQSGPSATTDHPTEVPTTDPVLWVPLLDGVGSRVTSRTMAKSSASSGALLSPSGSVFSINVNASNGDEAKAPYDSEQIINGRTVRALADKSSTGVVYRTIYLDCLNFGATTAGIEAWTDAATALLNAVTINGPSVSITPPEGWSSLGAANGPQQYGTVFDAAVNGRTEQVGMWQAPDAPVGFYLHGETPPTKLASATGELWSSPSTTTPGISTIIGERDGTAFFLSGKVPEAQLAQIAQSMIRAPLADWTQQPQDKITAVTASTTPANCSVPTLTIHPSP